MPPVPGPRHPGTPQQPSVPRGRSPSRPPSWSRPSARGGPSCHRAKCTSRCARPCRRHSPRRT
eukprot:scaffold138201_cov14-Tisochrysis_lutea.AAC.1